MRVTSRTIFVLLVGFGLASVAGCGSKPAPTEPSTPLQPQPGPGADPAAKPVHEMDPSKHAIPNRPVTGNVGGAEFTPEVAIENDSLIFRLPNATGPFPERALSLRLRPPSKPGEILKPLTNLTLKVDQHAADGPSTPEVVIETLPKPNQPEHEIFKNGYALTLELGARKDGKITGKIYLCIPDERKTMLAGTFEAAYRRTPTEAPGSEDVPFINGSVTVRGATPGTALVTGYANPNPTMFPVVVVEVVPGNDTIPWGQRDYDKPRVTSLVAGDGKNIPSRYEHSKLSPGRYLVFATLKGGGPVAWKWVDVRATDTITTDLVVDVTQVGGLEVTVPLEALDKVQLAPADEPGRPPLDESLFIGIAWQFGLEKPVVDRKALFKNLGPGRYEVRAAKQIRVVEVVAGKTVELDFDKKPEPEPKK